MLPNLMNKDDVVQYIDEHRGDISDPELAWCARVLSQQKYRNKQIRQILNASIYKTSWLIGVGTKINEDLLELWDKNSSRITLSHMRRLLKLSSSRQESIMRDILSSGWTVNQLEDYIQGNAPDVNRDADIKRYESLMAEVIGRPVSIQYNKAKRSGRLTLSFFTLDDLDDVSKHLGFDAAEHF